LSNIIKIYIDDSAIKDLSNIDETMIFGDDFSGDGLDTNKWNIVNGASATIANGNLVLPNFSNGGAGVPNIISSKSFDDYILEAEVAEDHSDALGDIDFWLIDSANYINIQHETRIGGLDDDIWEVINGSNSTIYDYRVQWGVGTFIKYKISLHDNYFSVIRGNQIIPDLIINTSLSTINRKIGLSGDLLTGNFIVKYIFLHKYLFTEPKILYIKPYPKQFYNRITIFNQSNNILSYKSN